MQSYDFIIVGGGSAGWMTAAALAQAVGRSVAITLVESDLIGTIGVGEATVPAIRSYFASLGLDAFEVMKATNGSFKLGIEFDGWRRKGESYMHSFGTPGAPIGIVPFYQYWLRRHLAGEDCGSLWDYSLNTQVSYAGKMSRESRIEGNLPGPERAFHFDASLLAQFMRRGCEASGVVRREGKVAGVNLRPDDGFIESLTLDSGEVIAGDMFIDCSGFRGLLIEQTLKTGYEDWSQWLPCNRAVAVPCDKVSGITPYTTSTAREAGWQWRIPLQHRTGNGYVFCESYLPEDKAMELILQRLDGKAQADPRVIRFTTGHRKKQWNRNVIAMGLASGFLEPLESTSIYLVQEAIMKLIRFFSRDCITDSLRNSFNAEMLFAYDDVKDFLIAHYKVTEREDTPFWAYCKHMDIPDSLKARLESFAQHNLSLVKPNELFKEASWFAVLAGQGLMPKSYHPVADLMPEDEFRWRMDRVREGTAGLANSMPGHEAYIARTCPSTQLASI